MPLTAGIKAPDFKVNDQNGKEVKLSDFKGRKVVLYFYPKDMTSGCTAQSCNLRDNYNVLQKQGYEVLGVSTDDEKSHRKFIEKEKLPFRLLADVDKSLHTKYGTWIEKSMYGRKYMGTARITFIINEQGVIEEIIGKVDTQNHTNQILKGNGTTPVATKKIAVKKSTVKFKPTLVKKAVRKSVTKKTAKKKK